MGERFEMDGVVYETLPNGNVRVIGYVDQTHARPQDRVESFRIGTPDPVKAQLQREQLRGETIRNDKALQDPPPEGFRYKADGNLEPIPGGPKDPKTKQPGGGADVTAAVRRDAINAFEATKQLDQLIAGIEQRYTEGPGATKGVMGVQDYLPLEPNRRFDAAGDAARGAVITALGFSSGQTNSPTEVQMNVGPYIPVAGDYDEVILDKIARLKQLRDRARQQAIATLGGVPDQNGVITPLPPGGNGGPPGSLPPGTSGPTTGGDASPGMDRSTKWTIDPTVFGRTDVVVPKGNTAAEAARTGNFGSRIQDNPALKGVNARVNAMLKAGAGAEQIGGYLRSVGLDPAKTSVGAALDWRSKHPEYRGNYAVNLDDMEVPLNGWQWMMNNAGRSAPGAALMNYTDALLPMNALPGANTNKAIIEGARQEHPIASTVGTVAGAATAAGGAEAGLARVAARAPGAIGTVLRSPRTADALYGMYSGATHSDDPLTGALTGGVFGVGGGMFGRAATRGTANAFQGVRNEAVRELNARGIPLTVGQALSQSGRFGSVVKGVEDRMAGLPIVGDMVAARRREGLEAFNRSAFDEALAPIGVNTGGVIGEPGIDIARSLRSQGYDDALNGVRVQADAPYVTDSAATIAAGRRLPEPMRGFMDYTLPTRVGEAFDNAGGLTGRTYQQALRGLRRDADAVEDQPFGYDFGQVTRRAESDLEGLLNRQSPGTVPALQAANQANMGVETIRTAVNAARNGTRSGDVGLFAPSQLSDAAARAATRFGNTQGTTQQPFFALTRAGQQVMPNKVPDSGTAGRVAAYALPATLVGGGGAAGYAAGGGEGAQAGAGASLSVLAMAALTGSRPAQAALRRALLDRPDFAVRIGNQIDQRIPIGGMFGAGVAPLMLPQ